MAGKPEIKTDVKAVINEDELEKYLQSRYDILKKVTEDQGNKMPEYAIWKTQGQGIFETDQWKRNKQKEKDVKKVQEVPASQSNNILINGRLAEPLGNEEGADGFIVVNYKFVTDKINLTKEEHDDLVGSIIYNKKTKEFTNEAGIVVTVIRANGEIKQPVPPPSQQGPKPGEPKVANIPIVSGKLIITVSPTQKYEFSVKDGKIFFAIEKITAKDENGDEILVGAGEWIENPERLYNELMSKPENAATLISIGIKKTTVPPPPGPVKKDVPGLNIEQEIEQGDYRKLYALARDIVAGKAVIDSEELQANYPKLFEKFLQLEKDRTAELDALFNKHEAEGGFTDTYGDEKKVIEEKYKMLANSIIGLTYVPPSDDETGGVPDWAQNNTRARYILMRDNSRYAGKEFQVEWRQLFPSIALANTTDFVKETINGPEITYKRNGTNPNYIQNVATPNFMPGSRIEFRIMTTDAEYDYLGTNRLTDEKYIKDTYFNPNGTLREITTGPVGFDVIEQIPIGVYINENGKDILIGTVHDPSWIGREINGIYPHIVAPEGVDIKKHIQAEITKNILLRNQIVESFIKDPTFAILGHIVNKSTGILRLMDKQGTLKERINPGVGDGGLDNRHGYFGIVRNGTIQSSRGVEAINVQETETFTKNIGSYSGVAVLMVPTPLLDKNGNGKPVYMPTFVGLPTLNKDKAEFIIEAWKAFTGKSVNPNLVKAVYDAIGHTLSGKPEIGTLRAYIEQYLTRMESKSIGIKESEGRDITENFVRIYINDDGNLTIEAKYNKFDSKTAKSDKTYINEVIRNTKDIPENISEIFQQLRTTIKFADNNNPKLLGINSTDKGTFLSLENGVVKSREMTYNEYIMESATTLLEKGVDSKNSDGDWVYFANPVLQMQVNAIPTESAPFDVASKIEPVIPGDMLEIAPIMSKTKLSTEDIWAKLMRDEIVDDMTDEQIKEEAQKCGPFGGDA